jgi:hypothetical protein
MQPLNINININLNRNRCDPHDFRYEDIARDMNQFESTRQWNPIILTNAAILGRDDIIRFALDNGCPLDIEYLSLPYAALMKKFHCVQLLHERGYPMDQECSRYAARGGDLTCLEYVVNNGAPFISECLDEATDSYNIPMIDYLIEKNCPFSFKTINNLVNRNCFQILSIYFKKCIHSI